MRNLLMRMTNVPDLGRFMIGFDHLCDSLSQMEQLTSADSSARKTYPPHNVIKRSDDHYAIELAVAGFRPQDLAVSVHNGVLIITGESTTEPEEINYLYRGLSRRKFTREFRLIEYVTVQSAKVENGILTVDLVRELPESRKPRTVTIQVPE